MSRYDFFVYILYSPDYAKYYVGQTDNVENRLKRHNSGYEKYTSVYRPWTLVWSTAKETRGEAMELEKKLKNLSKQRLKQFVVKYSIESN